MDYILFLSLFNLYDYNFSNYLLSLISIISYFIGYDLGNYFIIYSLGYCYLSIIPILWRNKSFPSWIIGIYDILFLSSSELYILLLDEAFIDNCLPSPYLNIKNYTFFNLGN